MSRSLHVFDNGVVVYDDQLIPSQRDRYTKRNVHEAEEEDLFIKIVRGLPSNACFVNVGSAIGYYALLAKRLSPDLSIHVVEPLQRHREYFVENIRLNGFSPMDFVIYSEAVSAAQGTVNFIDADYRSAIQGRTRSLRAFVSKFLFASRTAKLLPLGVKAPQTSVVRSITLDSLVARVGRIVDLLQMDIQGFELDALIGGAGTLRSGQVKRFLIGTHGGEIHGECVKRLHRYNYLIEFEQHESREQPDGILLASKM